MIIEVAVPCPLSRTFDYYYDASDTVDVIGTRVAVPFGRQKLIGVVVGIKETASVAHSQLKEAVRLDETSVIPEDLIALSKWISMYYHAPIGQVFQLVLPGYLRRGNKPLHPQVSYFTLTEIGSIWLTDAANQKSPIKLKILQEIAGKKSVTLSALKAAVPTFNQHKKSLVAQQLIMEHLCSEVLAGRQNHQVALEPTALPLNSAQISAIEQLSLNTHQAYVLEGVTGSGKTAVYIEMAKKALNQQQQVLIMVPEIGLTPQFIERIAAELPIPYVVIHSDLSEKKRFEAWRQAALGEARLVIGTRSSLFSPFCNLGLVIIDEAHDSSYRQRDGVRYSAHDSAIKRASLLNIPIVLGSATPSFETIQNINIGRYHHLLLSERAKGALPQWQVIDCNQEPVFDGLTMTLLNEIETVLAKNEQVMIFLNRRGYAPVLLCGHCGWAPDCIRCSCHLNVHSQSKKLLCHHCGFTQEIPEICPQCAENRLQKVGVGTQRIEKSLRDAFPRSCVVRFDRDNIRAKDDFERQAKQIISGEANIIIGTQMLAKGHDFSNISLVALVDSDGLLYSSDFRAEEKLAQLLMQVSGRSGRGAVKGKVCVQTYFATHRIFTVLPRIGYAKFSQALIEERKQLDFPPFSYQALLQTEAHNARQAEISLRQLLEVAEIFRSDSIMLTPVLPNVLSKRQGFYRFHVVIQSLSRKALHTFLYHVHTVADKQQMSQVRLIFEIDPQEIG